MPAALQTCPEAWELTREKEPVRNTPVLRWGLSCRSRVKIPSSIPCGWGWISTGSGGSSVAARGKVRMVASGAMNVNDAWGLAMAVCSRYSSTDWRPRKKVAFMVISTCVPVGDQGHSTSRSSRITGSLRLRSIRSSW
jgi:hypothetical protein